MADGRDDAPAFSFRKAFLWTEIFRCFQVALDPRKLLVAAAGILVMSFGWYLLSAMFWYPKPVFKNDEYQALAKEKLGAKKIDAAGKEVDVSTADLETEAKRFYDRDLEQWQTLDELAGKDTGRLRSMPWNEYRGPNPYLLITNLFSGNAAERSLSIAEFFSATVPVLIEPLIKLILPVVKFVDASTSFQTRIYLLLCLVWSLATWAFFGGVITRIAAIQLAGKDRVTLQEAVKFVATRYTSYILSPIVPVGIIAFIVVGLAIYGLIALIPGVGDLVLYGLLFPLVALGGLVMAILAVGLVGYPLMYATISVEGSDTFDALSRAYNYVFQAPWNFLWYGVVAVVYGAAVTLFVVFLASLTVYLAKWSICQAPFSESSGRKPDYLFIYAPESFGWRELFLKGTALEYTLKRDVSPAAKLPADGTVPPDAARPKLVAVERDPAAAQQYRNSVWGIERVGAAMVTFWLTLIFLLMLGFSYSYFWSASTMIYLLMRKKVDETELDEVFIEEDLPEPPAPPAPKPADAPVSPGATSLPTIPAPVPPPAPTPSAVVEPPATLPFSAPVVPPAPPVEVPLPLAADPKPPVSEIPPVVPPTPPTPPAEEPKKDEPAKE